MYFLTLVYTHILTFFNLLAENVAAGVSDKGLAYIGAALSIMTGAGTGIGQGFIGAKAVEGVARQPEAGNKIMIFMIVAQVVVETTAIYGLIVAFILIGKA